MSLRILPTRFDPISPKSFQNDYETFKTITNRPFLKISITKTQNLCI